jgi:eukaryotic-like serine/threonine-protein kinase
MRAANTPICERVQLDALLFAEEDSAEFRMAQEHVETCSHCQDKLAKTAADDGQWSEVRDLLREESAPFDYPRFDGKSRSLQLGSSNGVASRIKLDFLAPPTQPDLLGQLGRYQIERVIGAGGMGIVLKGFDTDLNRPVALKVLAPHLAHSGAARQRFSREARAAAAVVHEHVVAIHNVESEHETPFLVIQYVPGRSLQERVEHEGPLAPEEILRIGMQAAAGLAAAHAQGVIHRDVKPANILLENGVERALLTDFGLARAADDASLTHSGILAGTPHYMSPEQAHGEAVDARSDLFSLGSVLYFMATGHPPFRAEQAMAVLNRICNDRHRPVTEINRDIPDELADVIDRLLEKKPTRRYATAADAQEALASALQRLQQPRKSPARRWLRRLTRPRRIAAYAAWAAVAALILGGLSVVYVTMGRGISPLDIASGPEKSTRQLELRLKAPADAPVPHPAVPQIVLEGVAPLSATELAAADQAVRIAEDSQQRTGLLLSHVRDPWFAAVEQTEAELDLLEQMWPDPAAHAASDSATK